MRHGHGAGPEARHAASPQVRRTRRRRWPWLVAILAVAVVGWALLLFADAREARVELQQASTLVTTLQDQVVEGDRAGAARTLEQVQEHADRARASTHGLHWSAAAALPWVGPNVEAVQAAADVVHQLATSALPTLMDATDIVDPASLAPVDGRVDIEALRAAAPTVTAADDVVAAAMKRLDDVEVDQLWSPVAGPFTELHDKVGQIAATTATASRTVQLLPSMLGADGPRDYVLVIQDNAELRATGGVPRELALLHTEGGVVTVSEARPASSLGTSGAPVLPLTESESMVFGPALAADVRATTVTPDFPRSAEIIAAMWAQRGGGDVDGVISVDPGVLALLLDDTGPVPVSAGPMADALDGALTSENVEKAMVNTVYLTLPDAAARDSFFAEVVTSVLGAFLAGAGERAAALDALAEGARQGRLMVWSAHQAEQDLLTGTVLSGGLSGHAGASPVVGVFLNDETQAKLGYYLDVQVAVEDTECGQGGPRVMSVTITLTNTLAPEAIATLPSYVTGLTGIVPPGEVLTGVRVFAPTGGDVAALGLQGQDEASSVVHDALSTGEVLVQLAPGASQTISAQIAVPAELEGPVVLRLTPVARAGTSPLAVSDCS